MTRPSRDLDQPPSPASSGPGFVVDDGGRAAAGFSVANDAGDCVVRALAIATEQPYPTVYAELAALSAEGGGKRTARDGVARRVYDRCLNRLGWTWTPTMTIGSGCQVHLCAEELPAGRLVVRVTKHVCAVVDGVVHDTADPRRDGTRCVYGYWTAP